MDFTIWAFLCVGSGNGKNDTIMSHVDQNCRADVLVLLLRLLRPGCESERRKLQEMIDIFIGLVLTVSHEDLKIPNFYAEKTLQNQNGHF
jgi:hypothetical protein